MDTYNDVINKAFPKKVIVEYSDKYPSLYWFLCPTCGDMVDTERFKYCPMCGQKLDWNEINLDK